MFEEIKYTEIELTESRALDLGILKAPLPFGLCGKALLRFDGTDWTLYIIYKDWMLR